MLSISPAETGFDARGFHVGSAAARTRLERHGAAFVAGFNGALASRDDLDFARTATSIQAGERGFAYEGASMAYAILDLLSVGRGRRLERFIAGVGQPHVYMAHVGAGWALARFRRRPWSWLRGIEPQLRWLVLDGYGFHDGFFSPDSRVERGERPVWAAGYAARVLDQGLGRSLWFVDGADVERVSRTIARFESSRRADLWSGVGLAVAYAGADDRDALERLVAHAGGFRSHVAQGVAFAVAARMRAGNLVPHTTLACEVVCESEAEEVTEIVDRSRRGLAGDPSAEAYERWRSRIRTAFNKTPVAS